MQRGTVTAMSAGRRRANSLMAATSSGMCSRTSDAITRSKVPSANGRRNASPCTAEAGWSGASSPASTIAPSASTCADALVGARVERHHEGAAARRLERVAPEPAAEVEDEVSRPDAEPVVVDRQHGLVAPEGLRSGALGAPGSGRPSSIAW